MSLVEPVFRNRSVRLAVSSTRTRHAPRAGQAGSATTGLRVHPALFRRGFPSPSLPPRVMLVRVPHQQSRGWEGLIVSLF